MKDSAQDSIALCMIVKNEARFIARAIRSVQPAVSEIIVVDTGSSDNTTKIARRLGAKIFPCRTAGNLGRARNTYLKKAGSKWILVLDADETVARGDLAKLKKLVKSKKAWGYILTRRDYTQSYDLLRQWRPNNGKYLKEEKLSGCAGYSTTRYLRLFQKEKATYKEERYSAHKDAPGFTKRNKATIKDCDVVIHHFQFLKGEKYFIKKQKKYFRDELKYLVASPDDPLSYLNVGITYFSFLKEDDKAIQYLKKAIKLNGKLKNAYFVLGAVYKEQRNYQAAVFNLKKSLRLDPEYADALTVLGMVYSDQNKFKEAEKTLKKAIRVNPDHLLARNNLGIAYEHQGRLKQAEEEYQKACKLHPQFPESHYNLAGLYKIRGNLKAAQKYYRMALKINPRDKDSRAALKRNQEGQEWITLKSR